MAAGFGEHVNPVYVKLKGMLIDVETQYAGLAAKKTVLEQRRAEYERVRRNALSSFADADVTLAEARGAELEVKRLLSELERLDPADFSVKKPQIVWADIPEEQE
jgi:hypothetical protein